MTTTYGEGRVTRVTPEQIIQMKARGERIPMLTGYDYAMAQVLDAAGTPMILVGDSLGMVMLGYTSTLQVTLDDIIRHTQAVVRGTRRALVLADLPFGTFQISPEETMRAAVRVMKETGAHGVKIEGGVRVKEHVRRLVEAGIPVMGHVGMTPQSVNAFGGFKVQGKNIASARQLFEDVDALQEAGAFAIVLELVPAEVAKRVTAHLHIPTIGIGAGPDCDGEVQVLHDILGLFPDFTPKHTKRFGEVATAIREAVTTYLAEVRAGAFPTKEHSAKVDPEVLEALDHHLKGS